MKITSLTKHLGIAALVLGLVAGCASAQQQETEQTQGPTDAEVEEQIQAARDTNEKARSMGADWRDARKLINEAESAYDSGNNEQAYNLAREAERTAKQNIDDYRQAQQEQEQQEQMAAEQEQSEPNMRSYTVKQGDTLWGISGRSVGYNDPYQWPLIYRANKGKIDDADLIYPGQQFTIMANPSNTQVNRAIDHAKNRGDWELGRVEQSDKDYRREASGM
jgi:nucleoid-associated protein YgaU